MILNSDHLTEIEIQKFKNDWEVLMSKEKNMEEVKEVKIVEVETRVPQALGNEVIILNPLTREMAEEISKEGEKLPAKERDAYLNGKMSKLWKTNFIVNVGADCVRVKAGDECISGTHVYNAATGTPNPLYLVVKETIFKAKW